MSKGPYKGTTLEISAKGLKGALRGSKDGYTYFGSKKHSVHDKENAGVRITLSCDLHLAK